MAGAVGTLVGAARRLPLAMNLTPSSLYRFQLGPAVSFPVTANPSGGLIPYTYAWTYVSGENFTIDSPSSATTTFSTTMPAGTIWTGTYRCTVTDALGAQVFQNIVVTFEA